MEQSWRSPTGGWQSPRYRPNRGFGYGQQHDGGRFRSPPYSRSPNFQRSPRYIRGYSSFNSSYSSSPISQQQYHSFHRPPQQYRQSSPRGYYNQGGSRGDKNSIEHWIHPEMWSDPWAHLKSSSSAQQQHDNIPPAHHLAEMVNRDIQANTSDESNSLATNDDNSATMMTMPDNNSNSKVIESSPNHSQPSSTTDDVQLVESDAVETVMQNMPITDTCP